MPPRNGARLVLGLAFLGFVSLGLPDGLLGVAWPSMRRSFALPIDAIGDLLIAYAAGYLVSSFATGWILARTNVGVLLALSCLATATSLIAYALAPAWAVIVGFGFLAGLGAGAIDGGLNAHVAAHHDTRTLNWLHAFFGIGAAGGPIIMTSVLAASLVWQMGYLFVGLGQLILAACFAATWHHWSAAPGDASPTPPASGGDTLRRRITWLGIAAFFVYTGVEAAAGLWAFTLFTEARAVAPETAGWWVSAYWTGLVAGRVLAGIVAGRVENPVLVRGCITAALLGFVTIWMDLGEAPSFLALVACGFSLAPIFPSLIAATPGRVGAAHSPNAIGFQVSGAILGQSMLPWLLGIAAARFGIEIAGPFLVAGTFLLYAVHEALVAESPGSIASGAAPAMPG